MHVMEHHTLMKLLKCENLEIHVFLSVGFSQILVPVVVGLIFWTTVVSSHSYDINILLVFCRKDLCEVRPEMQSVFRFSDVIFALKSDGPPQ